MVTEAHEGRYTGQPDACSGWPHNLAAHHIDCQVAFYCTFSPGLSIVHFAPQPLADGVGFQHIVLTSLSREASPQQQFLTCNREGVRDSPGAVADLLIWRTGCQAGPACDQHACETPTLHTAGPPTLHIPIYSATLLCHTRCCSGLYLGPCLKLLTNLEGHCALIDCSSSPFPSMIIRVAACRGDTFN